MRAQLNLLHDRVVLAEACEPEFRSCTLDLGTKARKHNIDASGVDDMQLRRCSKRVPQSYVLSPEQPSAHAVLLALMQKQAKSLSAKQLSTLSLNLGVLDRVPDFFDAALNGERLRHPIELVGYLSNAALESLTLELRTLNQDYLSALYAENRMMSVKESDISGFVRQGRMILNQELDRTIGYYHEVNRIINSLRSYYSAFDVPLEDSPRTKPLLRDVCRTLNTVLKTLQSGMDTFEQRLRDVSSCNAALKLGASEARPSSEPSTPTSSTTERSQLTYAFMLPNIMRPSQSLHVTTRKQMRTLTQFFIDYAQIIAKSFSDWAMLRGNLADLLVVIRDPSKRETRWLREFPLLSPSLSPYDLPEDALSFDDDNDEQETLALLALLQSLTTDDEPQGQADVGPSSP